MLCLNTAEENRVLYPDELGGGFKKYMELKIEKTVFEFMCTYIRRIKPDVKWKKLMTNCRFPGIPDWRRQTGTLRNHQRSDREKLH
jgi:hypothetical protein